jgi:hypothetical protein
LFTVGRFTQLHQTLSSLCDITEGGHGDIREGEFNHSPPSLLGDFEVKIVPRYLDDIVCPSLYLNCNPYCHPYYLSSFALFHYFVKLLVSWWWIGCSCSMIRVGEVVLGILVNIWPFEALIEVLKVPRVIWFEFIEYFVV